MQFQDGGRGDSVLLQVSYLMWLHSSEVQNLQTQFHRYISINVRDITISGVEKTRPPPYWIFSSSCYFDHVTVIGVLFRIVLPNLVQIGPPAAE